MHFCAGRSDPSESEVVNDRSVPKDDFTEGIPLPPGCKDPELAKSFLSLIKASRAETMRGIESRMEQLVRQAAANQGKKKRPKATKDGAAAPNPRSSTNGHPHAHAAAPAAEAPAPGEKLNPEGEKAVRDMLETLPQVKLPEKKPTKAISAEGEQRSWMWQQRGRGYAGSNNSSGSGLALPPTGIDWFMHQPIDIGAGVFIAFNTVVSFAQLDWKGYLLNVQMGEADEGGWPHAELTFDVLENFFCAVFLVELLLRLWYFRCDFFLDKLNLLDGCVVVVTTVDTFIISKLGGQGSGNLGFIRIIRYFKIVRTMRFVRVMQTCQPMRILIKTILSSFGSLFWSMVILCAFMLMASLFMCQTLQDFIKDDQDNEVMRKWMNQHYGTSSKALWTMFEITFSGGWPGKGRNVIEGVSPWYAIFFFCYVGGVVFAVIHVVSALLIKDTLAVAAADQDMMMAQKAKEKDKFARRLREVFSSADESDDGMVNWDEFHAMLGNPKAQASLSAMGLDAHQCESLFSMLDDGDGTVSFDEFLKGVVRLKGQARSMDVLAIASDQRKLLKHIVDVEQKLDAVKGD